MKKVTFGQDICLNRLSYHRLGWPVQNWDCHWSSKGTKDVGSALHEDFSSTLQNGYTKDSKMLSIK